MNATRQPSDEQTKAWNGLAGRGWVEAQEALDRMLQPFEDLLVEALSTTREGNVLDVGCGTGSTTLAASRLLGAHGRAIGVDISEPMVALARARAKRENLPVSFICADAQIHAFELASFDTIISRFGVMFFADPTQAFANLRRAARDGAELRFVAWRSAVENPFMTTAERAATPFLPNIPARDPDAPGQFAFADRSRMHGILEKSGWTDIHIHPIDVTCTVPETDLMRYVTQIGPVGRILQEADDRTREYVAEKIRPAFASNVHGAEVRFTAACWIVGARASAASAP